VSQPATPGNGTDAVGAAAPRRAGPRLTVALLVERIGASLQLAQIGGAAGLERPVTSPEASSPGLVLSGYFERFPHERIQVFGETEVTYLNALPDAVRAERLDAFFAHPVPCAIITKGQEPPRHCSRSPRRRAWRCCGRRTRRPTSTSTSSRT
jgi:serine kinase of HPr protein (carbohydrate metabolism regulator)